MIDTKQRILESAMRLIQSRSYAGFSFQDIADEVGIRKASIYSHFRSKEALAEHVLAEARLESEILA
jgi:TetR/AcrR family transcriptional regulator, transcriptional repressor for nem operon